MRFLGILVSFSLAIFGSLFFAVQVSALDPGWLDRDDLSIKTEKTNISKPNFAIPAYPNRDCNRIEIKTFEPKDYKYFKFGTSDTKQICANFTSIGFMGDGYLARGSDLAGKYDKGVFSGGANYGYISLDSREFYAPGAGVLYFSNSLSIASQRDYDGYEYGTLVNKRDYSINVENPQKIIGTNGQPILLEISTLAFSGNGRWAVFDASDYGHVRMDLKTGEILSFGNPITYRNGWNPGYGTAISSDGRFVIFTNRDSTKLYDLDKCVQNPSTADYKKRHLMDCQYKELKSMLPVSPGGQLMGYPRFIDDGMVAFYASDRVNNQIVYSKYLLLAGDEPTQDRKISYLGLGDSFSSGEGAYNYKPETDSGVSHDCHTSMISYPFLAGAGTSFESFNSVACSGAVIEDMYLLNWREYEGQNKDGIRQEQRFESGEALTILNDYLPGKLTQTTFVDDKNPEVVTLSAGGNDIGFADKITECVLYVLVYNTCYNTYNERYGIIREIESKIPELENLYTQLKKNDRRVYVLGYPKIVAPGADCALNVRLNSAETDFADKLVDQLNLAIQVAADRAGVLYVDVSNALVGHRLCEATAEDVYVHGLTNGDGGLEVPEFTTFNGTFSTKSVPLIAQESFHPTANGQALMAEQVLLQTDNLTKTMPDPDYEAVYTQPPESDDYWGVLSYDGETIFRPVKGDIVIDRVNVSQKVRVIKDKTAELASDSWDNFLAVQRQYYSSLNALNGSFSAYLHSDPVYLGEFSTAADGSIDFEFTIPEGTEPGYHSLHLEGQNIYGEEIDVYDYFFVGQSYEDFDGDGVLDVNETCLLVEPIGNDKDGDGLDDACDGVYSPPTEEVIDDLVDQPTFNSNPEKDPTPSPETVAGNEEINLPTEEETSENPAQSNSQPSLQGSQNSNTQQSDSFFGQTLALNSPVQSTDDSGEEVLSANDSQTNPDSGESSANNVLSTTSSTVAPVDKSQSNFVRNILAVAGFSTFLIIVLLIYRRISQTRDEI